MDPQERAPLQLHFWPGAEAQIARPHEDGCRDLATFSFALHCQLWPSVRLGVLGEVWAALRAPQNTAPCEACICQALSKAHRTWSCCWLVRLCVTSPLPDPALPSLQPKASQELPAPPARNLDFPISGPPLPPSRDWDSSLTPVLLGLGFWGRCPQHCP